jgi:hypothetical protein
LPKDPEKTEFFVFCSGGSFDEENDENRLSFPPKLADCPKVDSEKLRFEIDPILELPKVDEFWIPCGLKEAAEEEGGGGPAGVVDGLLKRLRDLSGVEGGVESGTVNDILTGYEMKAPSASNFSNNHALAINQLVHGFMLINPS